VELVCEERLEAIFKEGEVLKPAEPNGNEVDLHEEAAEEHEGHDDHRREGDGHLRIWEHAAKEQAQRAGGNGNDDEGEPVKEKPGRVEHVEADHPVGDEGKDRGEKNVEGQRTDELAKVVAGDSVHSVGLLANQKRALEGD